MEWLNRQGISTRLNMIMLSFLVVLIGVSIVMSYVRNRSLITKVVVNNSRILAGEIINAMELDLTTFGSDNLPGSHDPARLQQLVNDISMRDPYRIRIISLNSRNPLFQPRSTEREQLQKLSQGGEAETFSPVTGADENTLLYLRPLHASERCIRCHGDAGTAPPEVTRRFPAGSPIYGHRRGELMGAVAVEVAAREIGEESWRNMKGDVIFRVLIFLILIGVVTGMILASVIRPIEEITARMMEVTESGKYQPVNLKGVAIELTRLANALNEMMEELARRDEQHVEAEKRFHEIMELAHEGIIAFLRNGKIVAANRRAEKLIGIPAAELPGIDFFRLLVHGDLLREQLTGLCSIEAGEIHPRETHHLLKRDDGSTLPVTIAVTSSDCSKNFFTALIWERG